MRRLLAVHLLVLSSLSAGELDKAFGGSQVEEVIRVRLDRGDLLLETILDVIKAHEVRDGAVLFDATLQAVRRSRPRRVACDVDACAMSPRVGKMDDECAHGQFRRPCLECLAAHPEHVRARLRAVRCEHRRRRQSANPLDKRSAIRHEGTPSVFRVEFLGVPSFGCDA